MNAIVCGSGNTVTHEKSVLIGKNLVSDYPYQLKIGDNKHWVAVRLTEETYQVILNYLGEHEV